MKHKKLFISAIAIGSVILLLAIFLIVWFWGDRYPDFSTFRQEETLQIPGLKEGACPQGITTFYNGQYEVETTDGEGNPKTETREQDYYFISAYVKNQPSRIYVVGETTGYVGYVTMKNNDEEKSFETGHVGGIATNGTYLWVSSGNKVKVAKTANGKIGQEVVNKATLRSHPEKFSDDGTMPSEDDLSIQFTADFYANCNAAFLYYFDNDGGTGTSFSSDKLYVGEFYRKKNYPTDESHHITTEKGDKHYAFAYEYSVSTSSSPTNPASATGLVCFAEDKVSKENPNVPQVDKIFSIPNEIQGFARTSGGLVLSQSYGLKNSNLLYYTNWATLTSTSNSKTYKDLTGSFFKYAEVDTASGADAREDNLGQTTRRVYFIDSDKLARSYSIPSMSEGLTVNNGRVYVLFESGSTKYRTFVRRIIENVYSFIPKSTKN